MRKLDYIYPPKTRTGKKRFGYARFVKIVAAEREFDLRELQKYHCEPGRVLQLNKKEKADAHFKKFNIC